MKYNLLQIGSVTARMMEQFNENFIVHPRADITDLDVFLAEQGSSIDAIATFGAEKISNDMLDALPGLKIISNYGVGYDGVDATYAASKGIIVTHTPNVLNAEVANTTIMLMLATARCLVRDDAYVRAGRWAMEGDAPLTRTIEGRKVGILGLGRIGETIAERLQVFNCEVSYHSRNPKPNVPYRYYDTLIDMAREVDFLVVITPGGPATQKLVNRDIIDALGPKGTLINVARGTVVDEAALVSALQDGRLGAAGLDVFEKEPNVPDALYAMENVTLLPHVGSATIETRQAMGDLTVENLNRYFSEGTVSTPVPECRHLVT